MGEKEEKHSWVMTNLAPVLTLWAAANLNGHETGNGTYSQGNT